MEMPLQCPSAAYSMAFTTIPSEIKHCMLFQRESVGTSQVKLAGSASARFDVINEQLLMSSDAFTANQIGMIP
jgi:hypothetical protein